jgi:hypothetical protein
VSHCGCLAPIMAFLRRKVICSRGIETRFWHGIYLGKDACDKPLGMPQLLLFVAY